MNKPVDAIYEGGAFRPVGSVPIPLADGARVKLLVEPSAPAAGADVLALGAAVYAGLTEEQIHAVEQAAFDRSKFFPGGPEK